MRILVCGDRNWSNLDAIRRELLQFDASKTTVIEGEARGADTMARIAAIELGMKVEKFPADWKTYGRSAGPIRNRQMLNAKPDLVLAFHPNLDESKGTKNMVSIARAARVPVRVFDA